MVLEASIQQENRLVMILIKFIKISVYVIAVNPICHVTLYVWIREPVREVDN